MALALKEVCFISLGEAATLTLILQMRKLGSTRAGNPPSDRELAQSHNRV